MGGELASDFKNIKHIFEQLRTFQYITTLTLPKLSRGQKCVFANLDGFRS